MNPNAELATESRTRADLFRVVVTGSECTGKSTLAGELAAHYKIEFVPEFVRTFAESVGGRLQFTDHGPIARGQMALEDEHARRAGNLLIYDTDLLTTAVYCRHYFGRCPEWIEAAATDRVPSLYLVCDIDVPWVADSLRDRGDRRPEMHELFLTAVAASGAPSAVITGDRRSRLDRAIAVIDKARAS